MIFFQRNYLNCMKEKKKEKEKWKTVLKFKNILCIEKYPGMRVVCRKYK